MKALLLCGSVANKSHTNAALQYIQELLIKSGYETTFWDLKTQPLPIVIPEYHKDPTKHPNQDVLKFLDEVEKSQIVVLGTPLYHGSYSGVLKNALDNLRWDAFRSKWIGLVGNAGSLRASHTEFEHLRYVVNTLVGYTAQTQVGTCGDDYDQNDDAYVLIENSIKERCQRLVDELVGLQK